MDIGITEFFRSRYVDDRGVKPIEPYPIAICTPMYNSTPFLNDYLRHITLLDYPRRLMSLYFTVQGDDKTNDVMNEFKSQFSGEYRRIKVERVEQVRDVDCPQIRNVVRCRNLLVNWSKPAPVFFIDHDNFPPPIAIKRLQQNLELGASVTAGVYVFYKQDKKNPHLEGAVNFTVFFLVNGTMGSAGLSDRGMEGVLPTELFGKRMWADAVAMGSTLMTREVLDECQFIVPQGNTMSDDTAYCMKAKQTGHKFIADFGLLIPHWGYDIQFTPLKNPDLVHIRVTASGGMVQRRRKMHQDGVYIP